VVSSPQTTEMQPIDWAVAKIAARQHGLIESAQLKAIPLAESSIAQRITAGRLHRRYRGVYSVGHEVLTREGEWLAAVLASGPTAALSHRSAAHLLELISESPEHFTEVTASTRGRRAQVGIRLYETTRLPPEQFTSRKGIRCTSVARTIADLAAVTTRRRVERAMGRAEVLYSLSARELLDAARYRKGAPVIRLILGAPEVVMTRSPLEDRFLALILRYGLSTPKTNTIVAGLEVDFLWERQQLIVETDGDADHLVRPARHRDRARDARLTALGYTVLRFGWEQVVGRPDEVIASVQAALTGSAAVPSSVATKRQRIP
jgi:very-short-patch-repair endonuclease